MIPSALIESLRDTPGFNEEAFVSVHEKGPAVTSIRFNPLKCSAAHIAELQQRILPGPGWKPVPWCKEGWYLSSRPSFITDPLWHAGVYYVQEASSMFVEQAFLQYAGTAPRVLDACAAPGGKSTHLQALMPPGGLLVSNEVIRTRVSVLSENLQRWGGANTFVTSNDPRDFKQLSAYFDVMMVDAPCSGSGLFRRDPEAIREWSEDLVHLCSARQKRILSDLWGSLQEGGLLIYSTCSYSREEDEDILDWLYTDFGAQSLPIHIRPDWGITEVRSALHEGYGYRFYPDRLEGEGFFLACLRKTAWPDRGGAARDFDAGVRLPGVNAGGRPSGAKNKRPAGSGRPTKVDWGPVKAWINRPDEYRFFQTGDTVRAVPEALAEDSALLSSLLHVREAGIPVGQLMRTDLVPDPGLALSELTASAVERLELTREQALAYLRKDELHLDEASKGWALVTYEGHALGWVKVLQGRINNYYPKSWRVLKR